MEIKKFPVLIFSPARCGSTALLHKISADYNLLKFSEPDERQNPKDLFLLKKYYLLEKQKKFAVKLMSALFGNYTFLNYEDFFIIRLKRKSILEQCLSYYIARITKKWHHFEFDTDSIDTPILPIDTKEMIISVKGILEENIKNNQLPIKIDLDLYYEDLDLAGVDVVKNLKPKNVNELMFEIEKIYSTYS